MSVLALDGPAAAGSAPVVRRRPRQWPWRVVIAFLVLAGFLSFGYPVAATYYNNWRAVQFADRYNESATTLTPADAAAQLAAARAYNASLPKTLLLDPWREGPVHDSPAYAAYLEQLARTEVMARIRVPAINVQLPVQHGTTDASLAVGAGHLYGTALPVGGPSTHSVLSAHSGLPHSTMFDRLEDLELGDLFLIDVLGETLAYRVDQVKVVEPDDFSLLERVDGQDYLTLLTCTPYGINSHRLLVRGERVPWSQVDSSVAQWHLTFDWTVQPWMWTRLVLAGGALLLLLGLFAKWIREDVHDLRARRTSRPAMTAQGGLTP